MKAIKIFDNTSSFINICGGMTIGGLASHYSWWILTLGIPHLFFMLYASYFRTTLKQLNKI